MLPIFSIPSPDRVALPFSEAQTTDKNGANDGAKVYKTK